MAICEPLRRAVDDGDIDEAMVWDVLTNKATLLYGLWVRKGRKRRGEMYFFNFCPYCGGKQNCDGMACQWADLPVRQFNAV